MPFKNRLKKKDDKKAVIKSAHQNEESCAEDPVKKKLSFGDLSPTQRLSLLSSSQQPILLYCRIRPQLRYELAKKELPALHVVDSHTLMSLAPDESFAFKNIKRGFTESSQHFYFNQVFGPDSTQQNVFNDSILNLLKDFLEGQNCLVFSYGVTNSGKTHTVHGSAACPGLVPRTLDCLFASLGAGALYRGDQLQPKNYSEVEWLSGDALRKARTARDQVFATAHSMDGTVNSSAWSSMASTMTTCEDVTMTTTCDDVTTCSSNECTQSSLPGACSLSTLQQDSSVVDVDVSGCVVGVWISCAEIYNEYIYDLLAEVPTGGRGFRTRVKGQDTAGTTGGGGGTSRPVLRHAEDSNSNVFIKGLTDVQVKSVEEAKLLAAYGLYNRRIGSTASNHKSSRSHCVFTIKTVRMADTRRPRQAIVNRLSIVDLAGSERSKKTGASGRLLKEAGNINVSLHVLGRCINAMRSNARKERACVPFRESKLTQIFQNYFVSKGRGVREGKVMMFVNISPSPAVFDETLKVLEISSIASKVVPYTRPGRGLRVRGQRGGGGPVGIENTVDSPAPAPAPAPEDWGEDDVDHTPRVEAGGRVVAFATPGPAEGLINFQVQPCTTCQSLRGVVEELKSRVVDLSLKLWEQEQTLRAELSREFREQISDIDDQHKASMVDQADEIESMYEQRVQLLTQSIKKSVRKKRRRIEEAEFCETEYSVHQERIAELEKKLTDKEQENTSVQEHLKGLMLRYESTTVELNAASNSAAQRASRLEQRLAQAGEELEGRTRELRRKEELQQRLLAEMDAGRAQYGQLREASASQAAVIADLEAALAVSSASLQEARAALRDSGDREAALEDLETFSRQIKKKSSQLQQEKASLQERLSSQSELLDEVRAQLDQARRDVSRASEEGQLLEEVRAQLDQARREASRASEQGQLLEEVRAQLDQARREASRASEEGQLLEEVRAQLDQARRDVSRASEEGRLLEEVRAQLDQARREASRASEEGQLARSELVEAQKQLLLTTEQSRVKSESLREGEERMQHLSTTMVSSEQLLVLERQLEKAQSEGVGLKEQLVAMEATMNNEKSTAGREVAVLKASHELQLGEMKTKLHQLSLPSQPPPLLAPPPLLRVPTTGSASAGAGSGGLCLVGRTCPPKGTPLPEGKPQPKGTPLPEGKPLPSQEEGRSSRSTRSRRTPRGRAAEHSSPDSGSLHSPSPSLSSASSWTSLKTSHHVDHEVARQQVARQQEVVVALGEEEYLPVLRHQQQSAAVWADPPGTGPASGRRAGRGGSGSRGAGVVATAQDEDEEEDKESPMAFNDHSGCPSLPNIEVSSQVIDPDPSDSSRAVIDVTVAKLRKTRRKRGGRTKEPCDGSEDGRQHSSDESTPKKGKKAAKTKKAGTKTPRVVPPAAIGSPSVREDQDKENTPKEKGSMRKKLVRIISKSASRRVGGDSTNTPERTAAVDGQQEQLCRTSGSGSRKKGPIRKSQISGPLDLIDSPGTSSGRHKYALPVNWNMRTRHGKYNLG